MNTNLQYRRTVKQWAVWVGIAAGAVVFTWLIVDVVGDMFRQGHDAWLVGFCLAIYAAVSFVMKGWGK